MDKFDYKDIQLIPLSVHHNKKQSARFLELV